MFDEQEQETAQRFAYLCEGLQVAAGADIGFDVDGRYFAAPLAQLFFCGSRVVIEINDENRSDQWVRITIGEDTLLRIVEEQEAAALEESDGEQPDDVLPADDVFDLMWDKAASESRCDDRGGAEYRRVRSEWDRLYGKLVALDFILNRANRPPE